MRVARLSAPGLRTSAREAWVGWPAPANDEVLGPVQIGFQLSFPTVGDAVTVSQLLRAPRPEVVWLMGGMEAVVGFQCRPDQERWQLAGRTQAVWLTLPLLEGFLLALWQQTREYRGVLEEWVFDEPEKE